MARELRYLQGRSLPVDLRTEPVRVENREPRAESEEQRADGDARRARRRKRQIFGIAVAATALIAATAGTYLWMAQPILRVPIAAVPVANHTGEPQVDAYRRALTQELIAELSNSPNIRVVPYLRLLELLRPFAAGDVSGSEAIHAISTQAGARFVIVPSLRSRDGKWLAQVDVQNVDTGTSVAHYETETVASSLPKEAAYGLILAAAGRVEEHFKTSSGGRAYVSRDTAQRFQTLDAAQSYEAGLNAYEEQEYGAALIALERAARQDGQHAMTQAWLSRVLAILERGAEAVQAAQRASQLAGTSATQSESLFIDAIVADSRRDLTAAEERYRRLRESRPDDPAAYAELADFLRRREISQRAVDAYHEALRIDPQYLRPHVDLCQLYTRLDDHPRAEREAQTALDGYRAAKNRSGEAQALLCLGEAQREQGGARLEDAKRNAEHAREILTTLSQPYNLARAVQYQALVEYAGGFLDRAARLFEEALTQARTAGNRRIESIALMNLGVTYQEMGERARSIDYYRQSRDLFEASGNDRRAAEQDIELANLIVNFGADRADALRRLRSARATVEKFGTPTTRLRPSASRQPPNVTPAGLAKRADASWRR